MVINHSKMGRERWSEGKRREEGAQSGTEGNRSRSRGGEESSSAKMDTGTRK